MNGKETDERARGQTDKLFNQKQRKKKRKSRRNKMFANSGSLNRKGRLEAIHLINKLNQQPEANGIVL